MKTIVFVSDDIEQSADALKLLSADFIVTFIPYCVFPQISMPYKQISAVVIFSERLTESVLKKIDIFLMSRSNIGCFLVSPFVDHSFIKASKQFEALKRVEVLSDFSNLKNMLNLKVGITPVSETHKWSAFKQFMNLFRIETLPISPIDNKLLPLPAIKPLKEVTQKQGIENTLEVKFFGEFSLRFNNKICCPKNNIHLLAFLLHNKDKKIYRDQLLDKFWQDSTYDSAKNCLNAAIFNIRKMLTEFTGLEKKILMFENDHYFFDSQLIPISNDVTDFLQRWEEAKTIIRTKHILEAEDSLKAVVNIYAGDFMQNYNSEWIIGKRDDFAEKKLQCLNWLSEICWQKHNFEECIEVNNQILTIDECVEVSHKRLMQSFIALQMKDRALKQFNKCKVALAKLNAEPSTDTKELYNKIAHLT